MGCGAFSARNYTAPLQDPPSSEGGAAGSSAPPEEPADDASSAQPRGRWLWEESPGVWQAYDPLVNDKLLAAQEVGEARLAFGLNGSIYEVNLDKCVQTHWDTGLRCRVRFKGTPPPPAAGKGAGFATRAAAEAEDSQPVKGLRRIAQGEWQFEGPPGTWTAIEGEPARLLTAARSIGRSRVIYEAMGNVYGADLDSLVQQNLHTGFKRRLRWLPQKQFQWQLKNGVWVDYEEEENDILAAALAEGKGSVRYSARGFNYNVDLKDMAQENISSNSTTIRKVRIQGADVFASTIEGRKRASSEEPPKADDPPKADGFRTRSPSPSPQAEGFRPSPRSPSPQVPPAGREQPRPSKRSTNADEAFRTFVDGDARRDSKRPHQEAEGGAPREKRFSFGKAAHGVGGAAPQPAQGPQPRRPAAAGDHGPGIPPRPSPRPAPSPRPTRDAGGPRDVPPQDVPPRGRSPGRHPSAEPEAKKLRLPKGVELPEEPAARTAAKALFMELAALRGAGVSERRKAYRQACLRWHPDKNPEDEDTATDVFQFLQDIKEWCLGEDT